MSVALADDHLASETDSPPAVSTASFAPLSSPRTCAGRSSTLLFRSQRCGEAILAVERLCDQVSPHLLIRWRAVAAASSTPERTAARDPISSTEQRPIPYAFRRARRLTARVSAIRISAPWLGTRHWRDRHHRIRQSLDTLETCRRWLQKPSLGLAPRRANVPSSANTRQVREGAPLVAEQLGGNQRWWNRGYLTGDGTLDVLVWMYLNVVPYQGNDLLEFLGNGDGTFATPKVVLSNLSSLSVVDVNHDGVLDVIESRDALATDLNAGSPVEVLPILAANPPCGA
jgi:hypothetical protein